MKILLQIASKMKFIEARIIVLCQLDNQNLYALYKISKTKDQINTEKLVDDTTQLELFSDQKLIPPGIPVILLILGEGVVHRIIPDNISEIKKYIPAFRKNDYISQHHQLETGKTYIALFRTDKAEIILKTLQKAGVFATNISVGFSGIVEFHKILQLGNKKVKAADNYLEFKKNDVYDIGKFADDPNNHDFELLAMGAGLHFFIHQFKNHEYIFPDTINQIKEIASVKINNFILKYCLTGLFIILIINFLFFDNLQKQLQTTDVNITMQKELSLQIDQLKKQIQEEEKFMENSNMGYMLFAYYIDRLAAMNIQGVRFEELNVNPIVKKPKPGEKLETETGIIYLKGTCKQEENFSNLLVKLNSTPWVEEIKKQTYFYDNNINSAKFEVIINYNNKKFD